MEDSLRSRRNIRRDRHRPRRARFLAACPSMRSWSPSPGSTQRPGFLSMPRALRGDELRASRSRPRLLGPTMLRPAIRTARGASANLLHGNVCNGPHCAAVTCAPVPAASRSQQAWRCVFCERGRCAPLLPALICYLVLPVVALGSRATGRELYPLVRGGRCRSSAARANCRIHNGLHCPIV